MQLLPFLFYPALSVLKKSELAFNSSAYIRSFVSPFTEMGVGETKAYIMKFYEENKLSFDIRNMIKREYYDATITLVKEYEANNRLIIYVHMQDKYTWKIVQINDGEMKLVENLNKG